MTNSIVREPGSFVLFRSRNAVVVWPNELPMVTAPPPPGDFEVREVEDVQRLDTEFEIQPFS